MTRPLVVLAILLAVAGIGAAVLIAVGEEPRRPEFTEEDAEAAVTRALERCRHDLRDARIDCEEVVNGFACRADGRYVAGFRQPDPEQPEFAVSC